MQTDALFISNYAVRPGKLFNGVDMNLTVFIGSTKNRESEIIYSTNYVRWYEQNRDDLFSSLSYCRIDLLKDDIIPKIGSITGVAIFNNVFSKSNTIANLRLTISGNREKIYYHSGGRYFRKCITKSLSNEYKMIEVPERTKNISIGLLSSSLYYLLWIYTSDTFHVTKRDVETIKFPDNILHSQIISRIVITLLKDVWSNVEYRNRNRADGSIQKEANFIVSKSKPIIDQIDTVLAQHYGFTEEELDFIINYDIKYRMGKELDAYVNGILGKDCGEGK
jgi:hypothetical protein